MIKLNVIIEIFVIFVFIFLLVYLFIIYRNVKAGNLNCINNPLVYGAKRLDEANEPNKVLCQCTLSGALESPILIFNGKESYISSPQKRFSNEFQNINKSINFSFK